MMEKYEYIFNNTPISICEENWDEVCSLMEELRNTVPPHKFMQYLNKNPDFVNMLANVIKVERVNKKTVQLFEAKNEQEIQKTPILKTFSDESLGAFKKEMEAFYIGKENFKIETQFQTLKGNPIHVLFQVEFPHHNCNNVIAVMMDITSREHFHKQYLEKKAQFQDSFYQGIVGMASINLDGTIFEVNKEFCNFTGYSEQELKNKPISILDYCNEKAILKTMQELLTNNKSTQKVERQLVKKNNKIVWTYLGICLLKDAQNNPFYFTLQTIDINDSKKKAIAHANNVKKYSQLLEATNAIYLILDEEDDIQECSQEFLHLFGNKYLKQHFHYKSLRSFVSARTMKDFDEAWKRLKKGQTITGIEIALSKDERFKWVSMNANVIDNGKSQTFVLLTDITDKKQKEMHSIIEKQKRKDKLRNNIKGLRDTIEQMTQKNTNNSKINISERGNDIVNEVDNVV